MGKRIGRLVALTMVIAFVGASHAGEIPAGYMSQSESDAILAKSLRVHLDPDLSGLSDAEREVVDRLIEVGNIFQRLHEKMRHAQALPAHEELLRVDAAAGSPRQTQNLILLYYMAKGPIVRTLQNEFKPFLPVDDRSPGRNVYPWKVEKDEVEAFFEKHPEERVRLLHLRSVVRRSELKTIAADLATLRRHPVLDTLHPGLRARLEGLEKDPSKRAFYACPYSVAFAEELLLAYGHLMAAGARVENEDSEFASYLRNRARDLISDDYESGDASWVTGRFGNLNAQIGSYEVYDDQLFGVKSFFGLNVLLRDHEKSDALREAIKEIQEFENSLPYEPDGYAGSGNKKTVREDIPVGVYNVVADFGQSRGTNTATILPNESDHARKYGRTILLRSNIMKDPKLFKIRQAAFGAAVSAEFADDLTAEGGFNRTLWHEVGHYLGVDVTRDGRDLDEALETASSVYEELKADLVSLFLGERLRARGYYDDDKLTAVYASGIRRVLQKNQPQRSQAYNTMQLMQWNFYLENGLLEFDTAAGKLVIHYDRYHDVVGEMLERVLALQYEGDLDEAEDFIRQYSSWNDDLHGVIASAMQFTEKYRYSYVTYGALESDPADTP